MKYLRIAVSAVLCLSLVGLLACTPKPQTTRQEVKVTRGDLTLAVSGSGNTEVSGDRSLVFGTGGRVKEVSVKEGDAVTKGKVLARLETGPLELAVAQAQSGIVQAQVGVEAARLAVETAENKYKFPEVQVQEANVQLARNAVKTVIDRIASATTPQERQMLADMLARAEATLFLEEAKLNAMIAGQDPKEVNLKKLQLQAADAQLVVAQQGLAEARRNLTEATVTAPFDGVVVTVGVKEGDLVSPPGLTARAAFRIIDPSSLELKVDVDEIDIPGVRVGQKAEVKADALPGVVIEGRVASINPLSTESSGVVQYQVTINLTLPAGSPLRMGMSASADIILEERTDVLLVPSRAVELDTQGKPVVNVLLPGGEVREKPIEIGISDGIQTQVVAGLAAGDTVVIESRSTTSALQSS